ncbi:ABC transporter permease [Paracidobacterium acidisoli]|uniref:ABC transporter permease n=1 Tax=Paracidobacterium acidisoli TaxID=2303751 RepID=A0A372IIZ2_9BACT|nr:ABC transporter permease [Paracidobacterium acidisoli]MBT9333358.1 ABC transporter permease [Paracidobacterium acidisoli]
MAGLLQDARFAVRQLRRNPGFTIAATVMLAVAICANSTVFSWINGTMLHPIPGARHTDELVSVMRGAWSTSPTPPLSYLDYRDLRDQNQSLTGLLAYHADWITLTGAGAVPERIFIGNVSANFFDVLGVKPLLGRFFLPEEETRPDAVPYVVLGYSLWKTRYAGDPQIVGKAIEIARHPVTVIGVAPEGFIGAAPGLRDDAWLTLNPLGTNEYGLTHRSLAFLNVLGRLRPRMSREQATQDLETIMRRIVAAYPNDHLGTNTITLDPMWRSPFGANGYMAATLPILLAIAGVVLLLTCANVATLTLVRFVSRRREIAIRQSLGAQRVQLVRQMVLEGVILSAAAGGVALLLTSLTAKTFARFFPASSIPIVLNGTVDQNVVIGIAVLAVLASVLSGVFPAWRSSYVPAAEALRDESSNISGSSHNRRLLSGLVVAQIALSLALLVISGLFLQTLRHLAAGDPGFEQDHVLTVSVGLYTAGYSSEEVDAICHRILDRVSALPTVTVASLTDWMPMSLTRKTDDIYPEGYAPHPHESLDVQHAEVTPRYFETLGVPILEGRDFAQYDNRKAPLVAIVDETAAKRFWPGQDPVGKRLHIGNGVAAVIGVVKNTKHEFMNERPAPMVYMSYFQRGFETIVQVRTRGNPEDIAPAVERTIHEIDGRAPVFDVRTMRETTQMATIFAVMQSTFAGILAAIALILATTGIYGVVAYRTAFRTHEIGIRVALGASPGDVQRLVLWQGLSLTAIGLGLGLALSFGLTHFIAAYLYGVGANDPLTVIVVVVLLGAMSLLACYFPARRATRVDPVAAIRAS